MDKNITIVIPVLNEEQLIRDNSSYLKSLNNHSNLLFVDGGSSDNTVSSLQSLSCKTTLSPSKGRGAQISWGAQNTDQHCKIILILHIDTKLPNEFDRMIKNALSDHAWGRFTVKLDSEKMTFKLIQFMMNLRSRISGIATGDQAIFVKKSIFLKYHHQMTQHPLMEDIFLSKTLKKFHGCAKIIERPVVTSTRYWSKNGVLVTIIKMWIFRLLYFLGVSPKRLYKFYY